MASQRSASVAVRPATLHDERRLLTWANDPDTRAASFRPDRILPPDHHRWLVDRLASPSCRLLIACEGAMPIGQIRFERGPDGATEIGISLDAGARGRGLGTAVLAAGLEAVRHDVAFDARRFVARVRVGNQASIRLFQRAGFALRGQASCHGTTCLVFELEA